LDFEVQNLCLLRGLCGLCERKNMGDNLEETVLLEDVFLFMPDGSTQRGATAFSPSGIITAGDKSGVREKAGKNPRVISLPGALVIPGFVDAHTHFLAGALQLTRLNLRGVKNRTEFTREVQSWEKENPSLPWVLGQWSDISLGGDLPDRNWVDEASRGKPLFLARFDMHSALANSRALEIAGIGGNTPDPSGGRIVRDPRTGEPTGLLLEKAMDLVADKIPPPTDSQKAQWLEDAFRYAHRLGLTAVHDVFFHSKWEDLDIYRRVLRRERTGLRVYLRVSLRDLDRFLSALQDPEPDRLILDGVKGFIDGTLGSTTAWLEEPYAHNPKEKGLPGIDDPEEFRQRVRRAASAGVTVSLHAIGDAAIGFAQNIYGECLREGLGKAPLRIEHFQHPGEKHIAAMKHARLFASVQPAHLLDDASVAEERLGPRRAALSYPIRSLLDGGCRVIFGSDWDVADLNPLVGLEAAVTRVDKANRFPGGWHPEQRISVARAIECYCFTPTLATRIPQRAGKLTGGMEAHLTVLDRDITSIPPDQISKAKALMTIVGGHIVYDGSL
jgi:predicted amidohydrolase YtcJ